MRSRGPSWPPRFPPHRRWEHVPLHTIREMFRRVFVHWGLPDRVRVDNGYPWGTSRDLPPELALWLIALAAACRVRWTEFDRGGRPLGGSGLGLAGRGAAVGGVFTVLGGLQSRRRTHQAVAGERAGPGAEHGPGGRPPQVPLTDVMVQT